MAEIKNDKTRPNISPTANTRDLVYPLGCVSRVYKARCAKLRVRSPRNWPLRAWPPQGSPIGSDQVLSQGSGLQ